MACFLGETHSVPHSGTQICQLHSMGTCLQQLLEYVVTRAYLDWMKQYVVLADSRVVVLCALAPVVTHLHGAQDSKVDCMGSGSQLSETVYCARRASNLLNDRCATTA